MSYTMESHLQMLRFQLFFILLEGYAGDSGSSPEILDLPERRD